jgi:hypothetical protein
LSKNAGHLTSSALRECVDEAREIDKQRKAYCRSRKIRPGKARMENRLEGNIENLSPEQAVTKASLLAECDRLAAAGVTFVAVHFDGYGDDGTTEEVKCYDSEWYAWGEQDPLKYDASDLQDHFEALVPFGHENDCGGFGDVVLDVNARKLMVERNDRFEDYRTTTYEV